MALSREFMCMAFETHQVRVVLPYPFSPRRRNPYKTPGNNQVNKEPLGMEADSIYISLKGYFVRIPALV